MRNFSCQRRSRATAHGTAGSSSGSANRFRLSRLVTRRVRPARCRLSRVHRQPVTNSRGEPSVDLRRVTPLSQATSLVRRSDLPRRRRQSPSSTIAASSVGRRASDGPTDTCGPSRTRCRRHRDDINQFELDYFAFSLTSALAVGCAAPVRFRALTHRLAHRADCFRHGCVRPTLT